MTITKELWGKTQCGKDIFLYTMKNESGAYVQLSNIGAGIVSAVVPDRYNFISFPLHLLLSQYSYISIFS